MFSADDIRKRPGTLDERAALDARIICGTPDDVRERYHALPRLAAEGAGSTLVSGDVVVCDVETTGLSPENDSLIEIAAVRLEGGEVAEEFHTFVNPGCSIPSEIVELTGISDADVAGAPGPREAAAFFASFAGDDALVAHNASFDRGFLVSSAPEDTLQGPWYDTLALSQIALPRLTGHRLADLAAAFGTSSPSHRATDDVRALAGVWKILLAACENMAPGLPAAIASLSPETDWELRTIFERAAREHPGAGFSLREARKRRVGDSDRAEKPDAEEVPLSFDDDATIERAFGPDGLVAGMYPGYEPREPQTQMALEVQDALRDGACKALEAGTGVGKSMAYLVPLALAAKRNSITVGVATKTNALMDQLVYHELPRLSEALGGLDYVALKGYEHYPCLRKLEHLAHTARGAQVKEVEQLAALISFISETRWGDLDSTSMHLVPSLRFSAQASPNDCLKTRCPYYNGRLCYLHGARRHAASADVVVTNHALLFRDAELDGGILPPIRHWVVDEAHGAEGEARKQLSHSFSASELEGVLRRIGGARAGVVATVRAKAATVEGGSSLYGPTAAITELVETVQAIETSFFSCVKELSAASGESDSPYDRITLWVGPELRESGGWAQLEGPGRSLAEKLDSLVDKLEDLMTLLEEFEGSFAAQQADLSTAASRLEEMLTALVLVLDGEDKSYVYSVELDRRPDKKAEELCAAKFDVGSELAGFFYPNVRSVVFTSATLAAGAKGDPFAHFEHAVGLDLLPEKRVSCRQLASSYDFDGHMSVLLPSDMPDPRQADYADALAKLLYEVHVALGGSVLTLFTNRREMEALYHRLKTPLQSAGCELAAQTRGSSVQALRERFLSDRGLSLFALKSFWEGFDAPGGKLRCVVVPRLPFGKPTEPLAREREARDGRSAWGKYSLPEAVIELKQAAGRLIRSSHDEGWLVLCDARLRTKNYGKTFLRAMPTTDLRVLTTGEIERVMREERPGKREEE